MKAFAVVVPLTILLQFLFPMLSTLSDDLWQACRLLRDAHGGTSSIDWGWHRPDLTSCGIWATGKGQVSGHVGRIFRLEHIPYTQLLIISVLGISLIC